MPLVRVNRAMAELAEGDCLEVIASDKAFEADIKAWSKKFGHEILRMQVSDQVMVVLQKKAV
jgi:TusA-related sulfurtransferase